MALGILLAAACVTALLAAPRRRGGATPERHGEEPLPGTAPRERRAPSGS
ncbi:hypothetical protein [Streptomyces sp. SBT349]|nr:hypothetical protein [Streptomyces sp. SBT349]